MNHRTIVIFISGNGSNMEALIKASESADYPARIAAIISDKPQAAGVEKAKNRNIPTHIIERKACLSKKQHEKDILECLHSYKPDILCLAGYMRLISMRIISPYRGRILNIHPSLLPLFPGLNTHQRALDAGMKISGCTVHIVTEEIDTGPILAQAAVPIFEDDTCKTLAKRILHAEHCLYPIALEHFITGHKIPRHKNTQILFSFR
ncbi:MAG: phosphoribosylglycinamide formyltransferase 1 [Candidatus Tokpelaia sp. JSC188]|nr:MAG: phosphoribosylglycinamide formyltransferase 1 [Candidatus Tokpelaia sp. JSC188]